MYFNVFIAKFRLHAASLLKQPQLYVTDTASDKLWETYLGSFPPGTDPMFRKRTEHDCGHCRSCIRSVGNVVSLQDGVVTTLWDFQAGEYQPVVDALSAYVKSRPISNVFRTKESVIGQTVSREMTEGKVSTWHHFAVDIPKAKRTTGDIPAILNDLRTGKEVFKRALEEIPEDAVSTVIELIQSNSLYRGTEWLSLLQTLLESQRKYKAASNKDYFAWEISSQIPPSLARIRNTSIGTLLQDLAEDKELDDAVRRYEAVVAPSNYKRPKAVFTSKMLEAAKKQLEDLGLMESLGRRFATLEDITVNNILFVDRDAAKKMGGSVFDQMSKEVAVNPKAFSKVEEIQIDTFVKDILPSSTSVEVLVENQHAGSFVSLIAPTVPSPSLFKWDNAFSWAYSGNVADSMKERVKAAGGQVDGVLRFSIQWNKDMDNEDDLDAHCVEPNNNVIYFRSKRSASGGTLDVDIVCPDGKVAVENITWSRPTMYKGTHKFSVHCFRSSGARSGFTAEVEFDGQIHSFSYDKPLRAKEMVQVAEVTFDGERCTLGKSLPSSQHSRTIWGVATQQFVPVSVVMFSPNYWDEQTGTGNKHYFFMLKDCVNPDTPNGFFNEYLKQDLLVHKRVFEALGNKMQVASSKEQLSGLGFCATQRNSVVVRVTGHVTRTLKVVF